MGRVVKGVIGIAICLLFLPAIASAQGSSAASISGAAKDTSGGVLPGVTVEASSPVLIEKVRTTVTDDNGEYKIIELRPGTYTVTFTLPGFSIFKRDEIELNANFNATVNAEMKVGGLEETITVSGQTPLVDTQNVARQQVISRALIEAVPTAKSMLGIAALMPAVVTPPNAQDVGGTKGEQSVRISVHGGKTNDSRLMQDGMTYNNMAVEGTGRGYYVNPLAMQETVIDTGGGGNAQYALGGAAVNAVPKDGGNTFAGGVFFAYTGDNFQGDNFTDELKDPNRPGGPLTSVNSVIKVWDNNGVLGGPVVKDRLWFIASIRRSGNINQVANLYRPVDPNAWLFTPDKSRPVQPEEVLKTQSIRLTSQLTSKDKVTFSWDFQRNIRDQLTGQLDRGTTAIEANGSYCNPDDMFQMTYTRPHTNRVLFEGGLTLHRGAFAANMGTDTFLSDYKQCGLYITDKVSINDTGFGFTYHGTGSRGKTNEHQANGRASMSYVTGSHNFKTGLYFYRDTIQEGYTFRNPSDVRGLPLAYQFRSGVPSQITQQFSHSYSSTRLRPDMGLFVQDQWRINTLTISAGLRFDYNRAYTPEIPRFAGAFNDGGSQVQNSPEDRVVAYTLPATSCTPCWKDLSPRFGVAWDATNDGKTAVKFGLNRYVQAATTGLAGQFSPNSTTVNSTTRSWNDQFFPAGDPRRDNFFPDCDFLDSKANAECGVYGSPTFGQQIVTSNPDPDWIKGWQNRPYSYGLSMSVDRQLTNSFALGGGFYRTWFGNFIITDDLNLTPSDFTQYCVTPPTDSRFSISDLNAAGQLCGLYDKNKNPAANNFVTSVTSINPLTGKRYGENATTGKMPSEVYKGADITLAARIVGGINLNGGWNVGNAIQTGLVAGGSTSSSTDNCYVIDSPQQLLRCKVNNPYQHRFKVSASVPLPFDVQGAVVYQNLPSINYGAARSFSNAEISPSLGRNLTVGTSVTIQMIEPFKAFVQERINQLDGRISKMFRVGGSRRIQANFDLYNLMNVSTVLGVNGTYGTTAGGGTWFTPTQIIDARLAKISVQFDF